MSHRSRMVSLGFTPDKFPAGTHICYLYSDEEERKRVVSGYVRSGIDERESVGYYADVLERDMLDHALQQLGVAVASQERRAQFMVATAVDTYCPGSRFVAERMLGRLRDLYVEGVAAGFAGARMSGEMTWALRGIPGSERLIEYEARINTLVAEYPLTVICQYDTRKFDGATIFEILNVHPMMLIRGQVIRNPYYMPPEEDLKTRQSARDGE